jgi:hypothetical protein
MREKMKNKKIKIFGIGAAALFFTLAAIPAVLATNDVRVIGNENQVTSSNSGLPPTGTDPILPIIVADDGSWCGLDVNGDGTIDEWVTESGSVMWVDFDNNGIPDHNIANVDGVPQMNTADETQVKGMFSSPSHIVTSQGGGCVTEGDPYLEFLAWCDYFESLWEQYLLSLGITPLMYHYWNGGYIFGERIFINGHWIYLEIGALAEWVSKMSPMTSGPFPKLNPSMGCPTSS